MGQVDREACATTVSYWQWSGRVRGETDFGVAILLFAGNRVTYLWSLSFEQCECIVLMFPFGGAQVCDRAR
jgi:hypothetical protein